ncbi:MAG: hypothetical protein ACE15D_13555 [Candidatus Eisenbacteria bacterium]|nr:hypothetical protein [Candidatus Eisenbacteria bacterium]
MPDLRDMLFADVPLAEWTPSDEVVAAAAGSEAWRGFEDARGALARGDRNEAVRLLREIAGRSDLESRQTLQAWHFMREMGVEPGPGEGKRVRGVVLEVHLPEGLDTLAAYADRTARFLHHGGAVILWEAAGSDATIDGLIDALIEEGQRVADVIGPWAGARRGAPPAGSARINMLTASGLHFGEAPLDVLSKDPMGGPVIAAGTRLMRALIERRA